MHYFQEFPKIREQIGSQYVSVIDITTRVKFLDYIQNNRSSFIINDYELKQYERPEQVSVRLYNSYDYTWTILLLNNVYNVFKDWYQPQEDLEKQIADDYGSLENCHQIIASWYDENGYEVSSNNRNKKTYKTMMQKIVEENEKKKNIRVLSPNHVDQIQRNFRSLLR